MRVLRLGCLLLLQWQSTAECLHLFHQLETNLSGYNMKLNHKPKNLCVGLHRRKRLGLPFCRHCQCCILSDIVALARRNLILLTLTPCSLASYCSIGCNIKSCSAHRYYRWRNRRICIVCPIT